MKKSIFDGMVALVPTWKPVGIITFTKEQIDEVEKAEVVRDDSGFSVCMMMKGGKPSVTIPLSSESVAEVGDIVNLEDVEIKLLSDSEGRTIRRIVV